MFYYLIFLSKLNLLVNHKNIPLEIELTHFSPVSHFYTP